MGKNKVDPNAVFTVRDGFSVPDGSGGVSHYPPNTIIRGDSPLATSHAALLQPAFPEEPERATAAPGERRALRLPGGRTVGAATAHHTGHAHGVPPTTAGDDMAPHRDSIPPEHPDSPASPFAPAQPAAGVVAPDVPPEQNLAQAPVAGTEEADKVDATAYAQTASDPAQGAAPVPAGKVATGDPGDTTEGPKGAELEAALEAAGLSRTGSADEKRARLAEHNASGA